MKHDYWLKQTSKQPAFPDVEWNRPQQASRAGRLAIVGGAGLHFFGVTSSFEAATAAGAGEIRVLLPDSLQRTIPRTVSETRFLATTPAGSISAEAATDLQAANSWSTVTLLAGDFGKNSETAVAITRSALAATSPLIIARDSIDLLMQDISSFISRPSTTLICSFAQLQKIFRQLYYPKVLTFAMPLGLVVETLHKFTAVYPATLVVFHAEHIMVAHAGNVVSQPWDTPMDIWKGTTPGVVAAYQAWASSDEERFHNTAASLLASV